MNRSGVRVPKKALYNDFPKMMFDNILFASFIPQILMVVGYVMCLSASVSSSHVSEVKEITPITQHQVFVSTENKIETGNTFQFEDYFSVSAIIPSEESIKPIYHFPLIFPLENLTSCISNDFLAELFCRPPPAFNAC
ncbi:MAG TPA: hypothetical protein PK903_02420 [Paludibacteraceae bacterium]|nr:hypothetical protein [Paludibacteraceae bacterium]